MATVEEAGKTQLAKYECPDCGWIYDPALGDPDGGIPAGTPFEQLPDNWKCPACGTSKKDFRKVA